MSVQSTNRNTIITSSTNDQPAKTLHVKHTQHRHAEIPEPDLSGALRVSHQQYKDLKRGQGEVAYSDALAVLDQFEVDFAVEGDSDLGYDDEPENVSSHRDAADLRTEIASLRHSVDRIKDRIRRSDLDKESKLALWEQAMNLGWQLSISSQGQNLMYFREEVAFLTDGLDVALGGGRKPGHDPEGIEELGMEGVAEDSVMKDAEEVESSEEEREDFQRTLTQAKRELKRVVEANEFLDAPSKSALIKEFQGKIDALTEEKSLEKAESKLDDLWTDLDEAIQLKIEEKNDKAKAERQVYLEKAITAMDRVLRMDTRGWASDKAKKLALMMQNYFRSVKAGQSADDSEMKTFLLGLDKGEANNVVQYLAGAFYEEAGKSFDEMDKILKAALKDSFLDTMATRVIDEQGELESNENIQYTTSDGLNFLTYWTPRQTSSRISQARARQDLQYLNGSAS